MSKWDKVIPAIGMSAGEYVGKHLQDTDVRIASALTEAGFQTTSDAVLHHRTGKGLVKRQAAPVIVPEAKGEGEYSAVTGNTWDVSITGTRIKTLPELIAHIKPDLNVWEIEKFVVNKWEGYRKDRRVSLKYKSGKASGFVEDSGKLHIEPLWKVEARFKLKTEKVSAAAEIASMKEDAKLAAPDWPSVYQPPTGKSGNMLELSLPDLHMGKLAWGVETTWGDYDTQIAGQLYRRAVAVLIERTAAYRPEQICLVVGDDILHTDNLESTTTAGTPVTSDTRYHKVFRATRLMLTDTIAMLRQYAPVRVIVVPGNHDQLSAWHLGDSLECWWHKEPHVFVDNDPTTRKYFEWGSVMLMWMHGDKGKRDDIPLLFATEQAAMFGRTKFREIHTGDKHQVRLEEKHGIRVRILPSLSAPDDWHAERGFVGNIRSAEAYVWNKTEGLVGTAAFTVEQEGR